MLQEEQRPRRAALAGLLCAQVVSTTGTRMSMVALPWFVLETTGSPTRMGVVAFAEMLCYVTATVLAAPIVDRLGARRASVTCDVASAAAVCLVPLLHRAELLSFPILLGLVAVIGALQGPGDKAKHVLLPSVAERAGTPLERATSLYDGMQRSAQLLGAPLAGVLIGVLGAAEVLLVDASTFVIAAVVIAMSPRAGIAASGREERVPADVATEAQPARSYRAQLADGVRFLRRDRLLLAIAGMLFVTNLLDQAFTAVLLPVWAREEGHGPLGVGLVFGGFGVGATIGAFTMAALAPRLPRRLTFLVAFALGGPPRYLLMALGAPLGALLAVAVVSGLAIGAVNPILATVEFERIPAALRARVLSAMTAIGYGGMPLGGLLAGWLVAGVDVWAALGLAGTAYLLATLAPLGRTWGGMDRPARGATVRGESVALR